MIGDQLYFQGRDGVLRQTIGKHDTSHLLYEFHDGFCGGHFTGRITAEKILQASYYWPTLFKDAYDYFRSCDDALPSPGVNPLEGSPKCSCGKLGLGRRS
jgi:hypothetical protein